MDQFRPSAVAKKKWTSMPMQMWNWHCMLQHSDTKTFGLVCVHLFERQWRSSETHWTEKKRGSTSSRKAGESDKSKRYFLSVSQQLCSRLHLIWSEYSLTEPWQTGHTDPDSSYIRVFEQQQRTLTSVSFLSNLEMWTHISPCTIDCWMSHQTNIHW